MLVPGKIPEKITTNRFRDKMNGRFLAEYRKESTENLLREKIFDFFSDYLKEAWRNFSKSSWIVSAEFAGAIFKRMYGRFYE